MKIDTYYTSESGKKFKVMEGSASWTCSRCSADNSEDCLKPINCTNMIGENNYLQEIKEEMTINGKQYFIVEVTEGQDPCNHCDLFKKDLCFAWTEERGCYFKLGKGKYLKKVSKKKLKNIITLRDLIKQEACYEYLLKFYDLVMEGFPEDRLSISINDLFLKKMERELSSTDYGDVTRWLKEKGYDLTSKEEVESKIKSLEEQLEDLKKLL
jgi:hypothetical protein